MKVKYDDEFIELTPKYVSLLKELMHEHMNLCRKHHGESECWQWGLCEITDISRTHGVTFQYGSEEHKPFTGNADVLVTSKIVSLGLTQCS